MASIVFFGAIKRSQKRLLEIAPPQGQVLIIGGGTGWIIPLVLEGAHVSRLYYVEDSAKMLLMAKNNCPSNVVDSVEFILGNEFSLPDKKFDCIITNFFLDCFDEPRLASVMAALNNHLSDEGRWYFVDFEIGQKWYKKFWQVPLIHLMIGFFRLTVGLKRIRPLPFDRYFKPIWSV